MMIDVDRFKQINDQFGHNTGDEVLVAISQQLVETLRESDIIVRYGGDEFLAILPETNGETETARDRIIEAMSVNERFKNLVDSPVTTGIRRPPAPSTEFSMMPTRRCTKPNAPSTRRTAVTPK